MFGRATIRLGIGPHSSFIYIMTDVNSVTDDYRCACFCTAVIYEALMAVVSVYPDDDLLSVASKCIGRFLLAKTANLQYIGNCFNTLFFNA